MTAKYASKTYSVEPRHLAMALLDRSQIAPTGTPEEKWAGLWAADRKDRVRRARALLVAAEVIRNRETP